MHTRQACLASTEQNSNCELETGNSIGLPKTVAAIEAATAAGEAPEEDTKPKTL